MLATRAQMAASGGVILPSQVASLYADYDADLGVTGSAPVTAWADQSGNGYHLDQTNGDPALSVAAINGHDAVVFDGTGDAIGDTTALSQALPITVYMAIQPNAYTSGGAALWLDQANVSSHPGIVGDGDSLRSYENASATGDSADPSGAPSTGTWALYRGVWISTAIKGAWNGDAYATTTATISTALGGIMIGGSAASSEKHIAVAVARCSIFAADLSGTPTETGLLAYYRQRYSLW